MAENIIKNTPSTHVGDELWISQINAGGKVYDIATHHNIKFYDGKGDTTGTTWNGLSDLEIVIPSITDIVQTPIEFAGTVGADGVVVWNDTHKDGPKTGYLVYVTANCTFAGQACEAGDMAIYAGDKDGEGWKIVSGENQVEIVTNGKAEGVTDTNRTVVALGSAKDVLVVEGKALALTLDYADFSGHVKTTGGKKETATGSATVATKYLKITKGEDSTKTIGEVKTIKEATKLADGTVTITGADTLVTNVTFGTFTEGEMPTLTLNADARTLVVSGGSLTKTDTVEDFVTGVTLGKVALETAQDGDADTFSLVGGIQAGDGQAFVTGIDGKTEFTVAGYIKPTAGESATFVTGLTDDLTEVVTSITSGSIVADDTKADFVKGFSDNSNTVIASVSANTTSANVLSSATVKDHVLSFGNADVVYSVTVDTTDKTLVKSGYKYTAPTATKTAFTTGGFEKTSDVTYKFNTANETTYTTTSSLYKLTTPELDVTKGCYTLSHKDMIATVPANTFGVSMTEGVLPKLTQGSVSRDGVLTGSVATGLSTTDVTVNALKSNDITLPGVYSLVDGSAADGVAVGAAGQIDVTATVDLTSYITGVSIVETVNA